MKKDRLEISARWGRWSWWALLLWTVTFMVEQFGMFFGTPGPDQCGFARVMSEAVYDPGFFGLIHVLGGVCWVYLLYLLYDVLCRAGSLLRFVVALLGILSLVSMVMMVIPSGDSMYAGVREVSSWARFKETFLANDDALESVLQMVAGVWLMVAWRGRVRWCGVGWWLCPVLTGVATGLMVNALPSMSGTDVLQVGAAWRGFNGLMAWLPVWLLCCAMTTSVSAVSVDGDDDVR